MKVILILLNFIVFNKSCTQCKINQDTVSFEYSAMSRGQFLEIKVNKKTTSIKKNRNDAAISKPTEEKKWETLLNALKSVTIENIQNLKAPSENRFFDGAAIGHLKITYKGKTYESQSFDHGNPHEEIAQLVKEMLSLSENIE